MKLRRRGLRAIVATAAGAAIIGGACVAPAAADSTFISVSGQGPIAINPAGTYLFAANATGNSVSKINLATDTTVANFSVGRSGQILSDLAINPAGTEALVSIRKAEYNQPGYVERVDTSTGANLRGYNVGVDPMSVVVDRTGRFAYVANCGDNTVSRIDLANALDVVGTVVSVSVGSCPTDLAIDPSGSFALVANSGSLTLTKLNLGEFSFGVTGTISMGDLNREPSAVAIDPTGAFAYVVCPGVDAVLKVNLVTGSVGPIGVSSAPGGIAINPAGTFAYVADTGSGAVSRISLATTTVQSISVRGPTSSIAINPADTMVYAAGYFLGAYSSYPSIFKIATPPVITSADNTTATAGSPMTSFTVTTRSGPIPTISMSTGLPTDVVLTDNGDGTATISGSPPAAGTFTATITAANGASPDATQTFTLTVNQPVAPQITSASGTTATVGFGMNFTVTTTGRPAPALSMSAGLPTGVVLTDNGDGTATMSGTPPATGTFTATITATNGASPDATQTFTLTVTDPSPIDITSADRTTGAAGIEMDPFTVTTTGGPVSMIEMAGDLGGSTFVTTVTAQRPSMALHRRPAFSRRRSPPPTGG